jgi:hypothetical protein
VTAERCERCDRPVATEADWAAICEHECESPACTWGDDRCWGDRAECEMVGVPIDWRTRARDEAKRADAAEAERDVLRARVAELRGALDEFGQHSEDCPGNTVLQRARGHACECGLVAVLMGEVTP